ncbi:MAG: ATP phosphoribosyltransferase regulatory subunit, partial [Calditrichaeota bacterium]|nr:ATP phosphoribosyltransferase regulatory subunit [Calditrichota bacterium]
LPKGFRDSLPAELAPRQRIVSKLVATFQRYGFDPLETPAAERIETLMGKYGEEGDQLIFKILKRGEKAATGEADLALRYDLTVPLARVVAIHGDLPRPFKRYQVQPVWRADKPQKGRYREFIQCDVDVVGSASPLVEIELLSMTDGVFRDLGFTDHRVRVNNRQLLSGMIRAAGVPASLEVSAI